MAARSGFKVCTHTCTEWRRGATWFDAGDAVLSFHRNCHLRSHTGSSHIGSRLWCHLTSLLLFKGHQSHAVKVWFCHTEMHFFFFYDGGLWNSYCAQTTHPHYLTSRKGEYWINADICCKYSVQMKEKLEQRSDKIRKPELLIFKYQRLKRINITSHLCQCYSLSKLYEQ